VFGAGYTARSQPHFLKGYEMDLSGYKNLEKFIEDNPDFRVVVGEIGFGRPCVGILYGENYLDYSLHNEDTYEMTAEHKVAIKEAPENAYHKGDYLAVLNRGGNDYEEVPEDTIKDLDTWVGHIIKAGYKVIDHRESENSIGALMGTRRILKAIVDKD
jgi:hypothetical protein